MNRWRITSDDSWESSSRREGYHSRYHAFLQQKSNKPSVQLQKLTQFGQGLMSLAIFIALFIAILTLFGMGLSWYSRVTAPKGDRVQSEEAAISGTPSDLLASPPAQSAGKGGGKQQTSEPQKRHR